MSVCQKISFGMIAAIVAVVLIPVARSAPGTHGYFYQGRCACGHDCYVRIEGEDYLSYSPGHGVPEHRKFMLRRSGDGWDVNGLPHSDIYLSPLEGGDKVVGRIRYGDGALHESWDGGRIGGGFRESITRGRFGGQRF